MKKTLLITVRMYQVCLGPLLGGACRYYPSCSNYALEAIERHGTRRGVALAVRRILRCHPFSAGGVDPVPDVQRSDIRSHEEISVSPSAPLVGPARDSREEFAR